MGDVVQVEPYGKPALAALIANGQSLSAEIDLGGCELLGIHVPAGFDGTALTFQAAEKTGGTFLNVFTSGGTELSLTVAASRYVVPATDDALASLRGMGRYIKVRSGSSGTPTNQTDDSTLRLIVKQGG